MKKLNLLTAILAILIACSCTKEPLEYESPYQVDERFYFTMEMGRSIPTSYGYEDLSTNTKWGPAMGISQDFDPAKPSTTIKVNNTLSVPVDMQGDLKFNFVLNKKGTDPIGRYDVRITNGESTANIFDNITERAYNIHKDSLKFVVTLIGKSALFGKYAEGNYSLNLVDIKDTSKQIPVKGSFRLHMME